MTDHPGLPGSIADPTLADTPAEWAVARSSTPYESGYLTLRVDTIVDPSGGHHDRVVAQPRGAVGVLALDADDRLLLVEQYRHAVGHRMLELPAGILDVEGEDPVEAAARELAEEADVTAEVWEPLLITRASPGYTTEVLQVFRAEGLAAVPEADRTEREAEEADMRQWWMPFEQAVDAALDGRITNAMAVAAILAEKVRRAR